MANQKGSDNRTFLRNSILWRTGDSVSFSIIIVAVSLFLISTVLYLIPGSGPVIAVLPLFTPWGLFS
jgi:hypothetical protein